MSHILNRARRRTHGALLFPALALAASLFFTACGAAGAQPAALQHGTPSAAPAGSAQPEAAPQGVSDGGNLVALSNETGMLRNTQAGFYATACPRYDGVPYITFFDYNTLEQRYLCNVPGCAHSGEGCGAFVKTARGAGVRLVLEGDALYCFYDAYPDPEKPETEWVAAVERRKPDGTEPQLIAKGDVRQAFTDGSGRIYTDGSALYVIARGKGDGRVLRIDLATGVCTGVPWDNFTLMELGAGFGRSLLALERAGAGTYQDPVSLCAINVDSGEKTVLHTWEGSVFGFLTETLQDGKLVYVNITTRELWAYDFATNTEALLTDAFTQYGEPYARNWAQEPGMDRERAAIMQASEPVTYPAAYWRAVFADDWIFLRSIGGDDEQLLWAHNRTTNETTQVALTDYWNTHEQPMQVHSGTPHGLLVTQETRPLTIQTTDDAGAPMTAQTSYDALALIDPADFAASVPNFRALRALEELQ